MTERPRRTRSLALAAVAQAPIVLAAVLAVGFGYLAALLVSGRPVYTLDVLAAAAAAAVTGAAMLWTVARMARAGDRAVADAARRTTSPTRTQQLPAGPPDVAAAQARVDSAQSARHAFRSPQ